MKYITLIATLAILAMTLMASASVEQVSEVNDVRATGCSVSVSETSNSFYNTVTETNKTVRYVVLAQNTGSKTASSVTFNVTTVSKTVLSSPSGLIVLSTQTLPDTRNVFKLRMPLNLAPGKSVTASYNLTVHLTVRHPATIDGVVATCL